MKVQWKIKSSANCSVEADPENPPIVTIRKSEGVYKAIHQGGFVTEIIVVFLSDLEEEDDDDPTYRFVLIFETEENEPDPLIIDEMRFQSLGAATVSDARCTWVIENGSATKKGRITVSVFNHRVEGGEVKWTLDSAYEAPGASLALKVKRQDAAISCP